MPLHGKLRMVEFLLRSGSKSGMPDHPAWATPIALAGQNRHQAIVELLQEHEATGAVPGLQLDTAEALVDDLVGACHDADDARFERVIDHFSIRRPMTWDRPGPAVRMSRLRRFVREQLPDALAGSEWLAVADARLLIARSYGFEAWTELTAHATT